MANAQIVVLVTSALVMMIWLIVETLIRRVELSEFIKNIERPLVPISISLASIIFSLIRIILLDGPMVLTDGYFEYSAYILDLGMFSDLEVHGRILRHIYRVYYPVLIAIFAVFIGDIIIAGILISVVAYVLGFMIIWSYLLQNFTIKYKIYTLLLLGSNTTMMVNSARLATESIFFLSTVFVFSAVRRYLATPEKSNMRLLVAFLLQCILIREVGVILVASVFIFLFFHTIIKPRTLMSETSFLFYSAIFFIFAMFMLVLIARVNSLIRNFLFNFLWAAGTRDTVTVLLDLDVVTFLSRTSAKYDLKMLEAFIYLFSQFIILLVVVIVATKAKNKPKNDQTEQIVKSVDRDLSALFIFYLVYFTLLYILLKEGRTLDRFFLPTLFPITFLLNQLLMDRFPDFTESVQLFGKIRISIKQVYQITILLGIVIFLVRLTLGILGFQI